jgi:hypothetical protein
MKTFVFFLFLSCLMIPSACKKNTACVEGIARDYTGLDGCGMLIDLNNGDRLMPVSIPAGVTWVARKKICIRYKEKPAFNICMAGKTVEIISLTYLD